MNDQLVVEQLSLSTAEEERIYFSGCLPEIHQPSPNSILPAGTYRVVAGSLYRLVAGGSPEDPFPDVPSDN